MGIALFTVGSVLVGHNVIALSREDPDASDTLT